MIAYVYGILDDVYEENAVIDVNGVGMNVLISPDTMRRLPAVGETVKLYTYTCVREDAFLLYGFLSKKELDFFKKLIMVNGIGPKGALSLLSVMDVDELKFAIVSEDAKRIAKAPGIGAKTAARIVLELKGPLDKEGVSTPLGELSSITVNNDNSEQSDAVLALSALGYNQNEIKNALGHIENMDSMSTEEILKEALKNLY